MIIFLQFQSGITTINSDGTHSGYEYERHDQLTSAHIQLGHYNLFLEYQSITARYKYITLRYLRGFNIGRWSYPWHAVTHYNGSEAVHLMNLLDMVNELLQYDTLDGRPIGNWRIDEVLRPHRTV